jgi:hypothetical protein
LNDERFAGDANDISFAGTLRLDQEAAVAAMLYHDTGVFCAPTAFGKTVTAAAMIAQRSVNTLVLVHRTELLKQWQERLQLFLGVGKGVVGTIGGGKAKPTGIINIAVMQSLSRKGDINSLVEKYGHHIGAASFDAILKRVKAKYVLGLTATPIRRDGQQPIIFMQCGSIRYTAAKPESAPHDLEVIPHKLHKSIDLPSDAGYSGASDAGLVERHAATIYWTTPSRTRDESRCSHYRFCRYRTSSIIENVGQAPARLSSNGLSNCAATCARPHRYHIATIINFTLIRS